LRRTMAEVVRCTRAGIMINMFASTSSARSTLCRADRPTQRRRTFYTTPDSLGGYVLVDFLKHRRVLRSAAEPEPGGCGL